MSGFFFLVCFFLLRHNTVSQSFQLLSCINHQEKREKKVKQCIFQTPNVSRIQVFSVICTLNQHTLLVLSCFQLLQQQIILPLLLFLLAFCIVLGGFFSVFHNLRIEGYCTKIRLLHYIKLPVLSYRGTGKSQSHCVQKKVQLCS